MKADERHKLKTNQLADLMSRLPDVVTRHWRKAATVVALLAVAAVVLGIISYQKSVAADEAASAFAAAMRSGDAKEMARVAAEHPDAEPIAARAHYLRGVFLTNQAQREAIDRSRYFDLLKQAQEAFQDALAKPYDSIATPGAHLALARIYDDRGEFAKADEHYRALEQDKQAAPAVTAQLDRRSPDRKMKVTFVEGPAKPSEFSVSGSGAADSTAFLTPQATTQPTTQAALPTTQPK